MNDGCCNDCLYEHTPGFVFPCRVCKGLFADRWEPKTPLVNTGPPNYANLPEGHPDKECAPWTPGEELAASVKAIKEAGDRLVAAFEAYAGVHHV